MGLVGWGGRIRTSEWRDQKLPDRIDLGPLFSRLRSKAHMQEQTLIANFPTAEAVVYLVRIGKHVNDRDGYPLKPTWLNCPDCGVGSGADLKTVVHAISSVALRFRTTTP